MDEYLARLRDELNAATSDLSESDWHRAPAGSWNSVQIVEHLGRSYSTTAKMVELAVSASGAPPPVRPAQFKEFFGRVLVVGLGYFPSGIKSPQVVMPTGELSAEQTLQRALVGLVRMDAALDTAVDRWGTGPIAMHLMLGPLSARQWRRFHYLHGHHHVKQILRRSRR